MRLDKLFSSAKRPFALEVFPPKRGHAVESVYGMLGNMAKIPCDYISVTYSAGGTGAREYTAQIAGHLRRELEIEPLAHLTCVNANAAEIALRLEALRTAGVENILALRGDVLPGDTAEGDFAHASDLIYAINRQGDFYIVAACYPEGHPESRSAQTDLDYLKQKLDAGTGHLVTQLFFDNTKFYSFLERARAAGIGCPVEAGIMPIVKPEQISRTIALSSASLPSAFSKWVSRFMYSPDDFYRAGIDYAVRQIRDLLEQGTDGIHLYAMNNPDVVRDIYEGVHDLLDR